MHPTVFLFRRFGYVNRVVLNMFITRIKVLCLSEPQLQNNNNNKNVLTKTEHSNRHEGRILCESVYLTAIVLARCKLANESILPRAQSLKHFLINDSMLLLLFTSSNKHNDKLRWQHFLYKLLHSPQTTSQLKLAQS